ncbi:thioredoxin-dependent thiol peroxidase [Candidatus Woesearchaeota archaeon]|nr:thioredoxin-dependent thiol peroxidase [Candidatus Woesearchaeota archaeon]
MVKLKAGDKAPDFELNDDEGNKVKLSNFKGKKFVLYFYPKDDTPGCTKEACDFRDNLSSLKRLNVEVLGVSNDDEKSHKKFKEKFSLPFRLLCDVDKKVSKGYGVYELKKFMGKSYHGITRSTFLIDEKGKIEKIFYKVNPENHIEEVMVAISK